MTKKKALNEQSGEDAIQDTTPVSENKAAEEVEVPEVETELTEEVEAKEPETEAESSKRKGYSERVRELNTRAKKAEDKAKSLTETLEEITGSKEPQAGFQPTIPPQEDNPLVAPGEEISYAELETRLKAREASNFQKTDALIKLRTSQQDAISKIRFESEKVVSKYKELDPDHESFNKELNDAVTEAVEARVKANPYRADVMKFVDKLMSPYKKAVTKEVGKVTENLAKQVSKSALKPTSIRKGEKTAEEKTVKELEKELGVIQA